MSVRESIAFVLKVLFGTILLATAIIFVGSAVLIFYTYGQVKTIGENIQAEISRNNTLYAYSYVDTTGSEDVLVGFAAQLQDIAERSNGIYRFNGISVKNADGSVSDLVKLTYDDNDAYTVESHEDAVGAYGDFRTVQLYFDVTWTFMLPRGTGVDSMQWVSNTAEGTHFDFVAPCLRYLK